MASSTSGLGVSDAESRGEVERGEPLGGLSDSSDTAERLALDSVKTKSVRYRPFSASRSIPVTFFNLFISLSNVQYLMICRPSP